LHSGAFRLLSGAARSAAAPQGQALAGAMPATWSSFPQVAESTTGPPITNGTYDLINGTGNGTDGIMRGPGDSMTYLICLGVVALVGLTCWCLSFAQKSTKESRQALEVERAPTKEREHPRMWSSDLAQMEQRVNAALQLERHMTVDRWSLYTNNPWRDEAGPELPEPDLETNFHWLYKQRFPLNQRKRKSVIHMTFSLWGFLWSKSRTATRYCFVLSAIWGLCPAVESFLVARVIKTIIDSGNEDLNSAPRLCLLVGCYAAVCMLDDCLKYMYQKEMPGASVRHELRKRLQWVWLEMEGRDASCWPAGRCTAVQTIDVPRMVGLSWLSMFDTVREVFCSSALMFVVLYKGWVEPAVTLTVVLIFGILIAMGVAMVYVRRPNVEDLSQRKNDWNFHWLAIASMQIEARSRAATKKSREEIMQDVILHSNAALVNRRRSFHYFFLRLVTGFANSEMTMVAETAIILILGMQALHGKLPVSSAAGIITALRSLKASHEKLTTIWLNVIEGYTSLLTIAQVFDYAVRKGGDDEDSDEEDETTEGEDSELSGERADLPALV